MLEYEYISIKLLETYFSSNNLKGSPPTTLILVFCSIQVERIKADAPVITVIFVTDNIAVFFIA